MKYDVRGMRTVGRFASFLYYAIVASGIWFLMCVLSGCANDPETNAKILDTLGDVIMNAVFFIPVR